MAPDDRGLKWEGQVLGDQDMVTSTLSGVWDLNSLALLLPHRQPKGFFFFLILSPHPFFFPFFPFFVRRLLFTLNLAARLSLFFVKDRHLN